MIHALLALAAAQPPNIVYIMADDLGYGELGCYGQQKIPTPNIDQIAKDGIRFTDFYSASPVCAPTRYSLLTGKHQGHAAIRGNKEVAPGFGPNDPEGQFPIAQSETTIAEVLKTKGYRTALIGKWGLGAPGPTTSPMAHGFDRFYGFLCQRRAHNHYPTYLWSDFGIDLLPGNFILNAHQRIPIELNSEDDYYKNFTGVTHAGEAMGKQAVEFIKASKGGPFFLYYAPTVPHAALQAPKKWVDKFPREWDPKPYLGDKSYLPNARPHATYAAMIAMMDQAVGDIQKALDETGTAANTLIIFTSDNGATFNGGVDREFFQSNAPLRGFKTNSYEGGIRVPFVAKWPGVIPAGSVSHHAAACYDSFATMAEAASARSPKTDGHSFLAALRGQSPKASPFLYWEYPESAAQQVVRIGSFKIIRPECRKNPEKVEVYDLANDIGETKDLAKERPDLVKQGLEIMKREHIPNKDFPLPGIDR